MGFFSKSVQGLLAPKIVMGVGGSNTAAGSSSVASASSVSASSAASGTSVAASTSTSSTSSCPSLDVEARLRGALWGFFAGDALAAPTHWYYGGRDQVISDYDGPIVDYVKPKLQLWGSILNKSNLNGGGRATNNGGRNNNKDKNNPNDDITIIGNVINHGKQGYWDPNKSIHYHATLQRGETTLEASLARVLMKSIVANGGVFDAHHFRQAYMDFMMTPGSHNDTYASTCHRMFFANFIFHKLPPELCPDNDQHNVDTIDGLVLPTIAAMTMMIRSKVTTSDLDTDGGNGDDDSTITNRITPAMVSSSCAAVTRKSQVLEHASRQWGQFVYECLTADTEEQVTTALQTCAKAMGLRRQLRTQGPDEMTACYLSQAAPALLDMVSRYHTLGMTKGSSSGSNNNDNNNNNNNNQNHNRHQMMGVALQQALLSNANVGGENVHRGSILGAVLGARAGLANVPPLLINGLYHHDQLAQEIDDFVAAVLPMSSLSTSTSSLPTVTATVVQQQE